MNIDKLKQVIQEANPEIMELGFGCEVEVKNTNYSVKVICDILKNSDGEEYIYITHGATANIIYLRPQKHEDKILKILGRPITLADVLIAIEYNGINLSFRYYYKEDLHIQFEKEGKLLGIWNLLKNNLDDQSKETKQFLIDLLEKKEKE